MAHFPPDFTVTSHGTVWTLRAISEEAKAFARENFAVEDWQGVPENFAMDWRVARDLAHRLVEEGWRI